MAAVLRSIAPGPDRPGCGPNYSQGSWMCPGCCAGKPPPKREPVTAREKYLSGSGVLELVRRSPPPPFLLRPLLHAAPKIPTHIQHPFSMAPQEMTLLDEVTLVVVCIANICECFR